MVRSYKNAQMNHIPSRWRSIGSPYRDWSLDRLLNSTLPQERLKSPSTLDKEFSAVKGFLSWADAQGYDINHRIFGILNIEVPSSQATAYDPFNAEHLQLIFNHQGYSEDKFRASYRFWLPVIGLFTGMRLSEICWLSPDNIKQKNGTWVFIIEQSKTTDMPRYVPIHSFLLNDLRIIEYRNWASDRNYKRIFYELEPREDDAPFRTPSDWFNQTHLKSLGLKDVNENLTFHSFRHTFISRAVNMGLNLELTQRIVGHRSGETSTTLRHYFHEDPQALYEQVVSRINYDVDLGHLRKSKWLK